ncbi:MAG TPA: carboxylesterase family protein [Myxococcota bacterium]|nr:carboxylesterase family protein [Myxococcota bacterium]
MSTVVTTRQGRLEGARARRGVVFRGVPYAQPPVGALRFRAPEPPKPWTGTREARRFGASAPQAGAQNWLVRRFAGASAGQSEDCLTLNLWTPAADGRRRAVLVFLHGGAFLMGSGSTLLYDGGRLSARGDVVVVTLNYRLGVLGSLLLDGVVPGGKEVPGNLGLRDQIAALEWVRANIEAFGGDPEAVTVFGESAGAMSVGALLAAPRARGLFQRAILQSGAAHNVSTREQALRVAEELVARLGEHGRSVEALRDAPLARLMNAQAETSLALALRLGLAFQPAVDGDLLPEPPREALARGAAAEVGILAGTNTDEWKLFMLGDWSARRMDEAALERRFARVLGEGSAQPASKLYARAHGARAPEAPHERWAAFQSDRIFHGPAAQLLDSYAARSRTSYAYSFAWAPPLVGGRIGACHGIELPFVFGAILEPWMRPWLGMAGGARKLAHRVQEAWIAFAKTGHPGHAGLPYWPAYDTEKRQAMRLARGCRVEPDYGQRALELGRALG